LLLAGVRGAVSFAFPRVGYRSAGRIQIQGRTQGDDVVRYWLYTLRLWSLDVHYRQARLGSLGWGTCGRQSYPPATLRIPVDTEDLVYTISGFSNGSATFEYNATTRTCVISSTILTDAEDTASSPLEDRQTAQDDILAVLRSVKVEMCPDHTDANGSIEYSVTTLDVRADLRWDRTAI
jgi:hypothetical protein